MNKDMIRIEKMKEDRAALLKEVRDSIQKNGGCLSESIDQVITVLDFDDKCVKKYEAMVNAQELISELTQEIIEAKTSDEVFAIRKRLNYYINKIKAEIKKRDVESAVVEDYQEKVSSLRKDIAKYIRYLKREGTILEIDHLYNNYDQLTTEELEQYKKLLRREISYNRRIVASKEKASMKELREESVVTEENPVVENVDSIEETTPKVEEASLNEQSTTEEECNPFDLSFLKFDKKEEEEEKFDFEFDENPLDESFSPEAFKLDIDARELSKSLPRSLANVEFKDVDEFLTERVSRFNGQYNVVETFDYRRHSLGKNVINFFRNIPRYLHNKKSINMMKRDYCIYYRGEDLHSYIEYMMRRNSIKQGLKCIFKRSHLYSRENRYLNRHEKCNEWLYNFCRENSMDLPYHLGKTIS